MSYRRYRGDAPCLGCRRSGKIRERVEKDSLCSDCESLLRLGKDYKTQIEKDQNEYVSLKIFGNCLLWDKSGFKSLSLLLKALDVGDAKETHSGEGIYIGYPESNNLCRVKVQKNVGEALKYFIDEVRDMLGKQKKRGFEEGSNLLMALNSGKLALKDFERDVERG